MGSRRQSYAPRFALKFVMFVALVTALVLLGVALGGGP